MSFRDMATPDNAEHIGPEQTGDNIEAKRVAGYLWNGTDWERATDIQNVEMINALRSLLQAVSVPSWYDPSTNSLRVGTTAVTVSSGTVTNLTNFGTNAADVMARDISISTWAMNSRSTIT